MATYYRWRKSTIAYVPQKGTGTYTSESIGPFYEGTVNQQTVYYATELIATDANTLVLSGEIGSVTFPSVSMRLSDLGVPDGQYYFATKKTNIYYSSSLSETDLVAFGTAEKCASDWSRSTSSSGTFTRWKVSTNGAPIYPISIVATAGDFQEYVYSTSSSAYPNGGKQGNYYYDQRTTVSSPVMTAPDYPNPITTQTVTVTWEEGTSNIPSVPIDHYEFLWDNGMGNGSVKVGNATSYQFNIPAGTTSIQFGIKAVDTNGYGTLAWGNTVVVYTSPTLTVPQMVMQGQSATISWTAIEGADSYTLQRKSSEDEDWMQVYSGVDLSYTETMGTWTSVQYRVQAVFDGTGGGWAESNSIPVISASALVISGSDSDLGTLVNDVQYTINTDTGNQITAKVTVNSAVVFSGNVTSGAASTISIFDLVNGTGTIVIEASVQASSGVVNATRTWTYTKAELTFPDTGSIAQLLQKGKNIFPKTLAECVRLPGGRTLDEITGFPCQVYTGSYVGTGTSGASNPNTIESPFKPLEIEIFAQTATAGPARATIGWVRGVQTGSSMSLGNTNVPSVFTNVNLTWNEKSLSWYVSGTVADDDYQFNVSGVTYIYRIIG